VDLLPAILSLNGDSSNIQLYSDREIANIIQKIRGRAFFTTEDGHIGTAPSVIQAGEMDITKIYSLMKLTWFIEDHVCIFLGCYFPIVLRSVDSGQFQIVGEAYVHGLEDAIGILGTLPSNWRVIIEGDAVGRPLPSLF
jgi:hypothetical protein